MKSNTAVAVPQQERGSPSARGPDSKSRDEAALLEKIDALLKKDQAAAALELIRRSKLHTPWIENATGVCQMRLGAAQVAVDVLRRIVVSNAIYLRDDVPVIFKINFATALCLVENYSGCLSALAEIRQEQHPAVVRMRACILAWKRQMSLWQRICWACGGPARVPLRLDFPPGELF
jgi:hypothetical protein